MTKATIKLINEKVNELNALVEKKSGNKNPDYYKTLKESRLWVAIQMLITNPEGPATEDYIALLAQPAVQKTVIEVKEGDDFLELSKKYIDKPGSAILKAIETAGLKLEGVKVVKA